MATEHHPAPAHSEVHGHGHSHGLIDPAAVRSREGLRTVGVSLAVLLVTAVAQAAIYVGTGSVALLADLIHNAGDALTAVPLGIAFLLRSRRAERRAGAFVVLAILLSAIVAGGGAVRRRVGPPPPADPVAPAPAGGGRLPGDPPPP